MVQPSAPPVVGACNRLPASLLPALQEYDPETLDIERDAVVIIDRALEYGDGEALRWVFDRFGEARIRDAVIERGARHLSARAFGFWRVVLGIEHWRPHPWPEAARAVWPYRG